MKLDDHIFPVVRTKGKGRGAKMGIPTLNFEIPENLTLPFGIYAGWLRQENKQYQAAIHFGPRPQFNETDPSLEAYLIHNETLESDTDLQLQLISFIRKVQKFSSVEEMLKRITIDIEQIKQILVSL